MAITDRQLSAIAKQNQYEGSPELNDGEGLIAKISPKAKISFQYRCRFNGKNRRIRIGKYPTITLKDARRIHKLMIELRDQGKNPEIAITGDTDFVTVDQCTDLWLEHQLKYRKVGTYDLYLSVAKNYFYGSFPDRNVETIAAREWMAWLDAIAEKNPKTANSVYVKMRACLNFCKSKFLVDQTNFEKLRQRDVGQLSEPGTRVLSFSELAKIWIAIERSQGSTSNKLLHQLTMLWGNRISELRLARKSHFDLQAKIWTVPSTISKTKKVIRRPIPDKVLPMLERLFNTYDDVLFPGWDLDEPITISAANRFVRRIRNSLKLEHWRAHDFRRSISTGASELGAMPHVTEKMLGHDLGGVLAVYNKHDWIEEQGVAYNKYIDKIFEAIDEQIKSTNR